MSHEALYLYRVVPRQLALAIVAILLFQLMTYPIGIVQNGNAQYTSSKSISNLTYNFYFDSPKELSAGFTINKFEAIKEAYMTINTQPPYWDKPAPSNLILSIDAQEVWGQTGEVGLLNSYPSYSAISVGPGSYNNTFGFKLPRDAIINQAQIYLASSYIETNMEEIREYPSDGAPDWYGSSTGSGDINGDGYADMAIANQKEGKVYLYLGAKSFSTKPVMIYVPTQPGQQFGRAISLAGDLNRDGYNDLVIDSINSSKNDSIYIYFGGQVLKQAPDLVLNANSTLKLISDGDLNGDGYDDLITVGNSTINIYYGGAIINTTAGASIALPRLYWPTQYKGDNVDFAGDVNGDGYDDILIGDVYNRTAFIYYGNSTFDTTPDIQYPDDDLYSGFGSKVLGIGDFNGDGYDDIAMSSSTGEDFGIPNSYYIFYGGVSPYNMTHSVVYGKDIWEAGDLNGDGKKDLAVISLREQIFIEYGGPNFNYSQDRSIFAPHDYMWSLGYWTTTSGDINNDGKDELAIGLCDCGWGQEPGIAYIYNDVEGFYYHNSSPIISLGNMTIWSYHGPFIFDERTISFNTILQQYLPMAPSAGLDSYGHDWASLALNLTAQANTTIYLSYLYITYSIRVDVRRYVEDYRDAHRNDDQLSDTLKVPFNISANSSGFVDVTIDIVDEYPPSVGLVSPINGTVIKNELLTKLIWNGFDENGDILNYTVNLTYTLEEDHNATKSTSYNASHETSITLENLKSGKYSWHVIADDGRFKSMSATWNFTIIINYPPTYELVSPVNKAIIWTDNVTLKWSGHDPENDEIIYSLYFGFTPETMYYKGDYVRTYEEFKNLANGTYYWKIVASDKYGTTDNNDGPWSFTVRLSSPPIILDRNPAVRDVFLIVGQDTEFSIKAIDPNQGRLTVAWCVNNGSLVNGESFVFTATEPGLFEIKANISNDYYTISETWNIHVNHRPRLIYINPNMTAIDVQSGHDLNLSVYAVDDDYDALMYIWFVNSTQVAIGHDYKFQAKEDDTGTRSINVLITDGHEPITVTWIIIIDRPVPPRYEPPREHNTSATIIFVIGIFTALAIILLSFAFIKRRKETQRSKTRHIKGKIKKVKPSNSLKHIKKMRSQLPNQGRRKQD